MENPRSEKVAVVTEVRERFEAADAALLTEYRGLTVKALADLRRQLRPSGGDYKVYKNTLVRFAARDHGVGELESLLTGPTAIAFVRGDTAAVAKSLRDFARTNPNLVVKGGLLGTKVLTAEDVQALADLPPREVLLARLAGAFQAPMATFAGLLAAVPRNFAYGLKALIDQGGAAGDAGASPAAEAAPTDEAPTEAAPAADADAPSADVDAPAADASTAAADAAPADAGSSAPTESAESEPAAPQE
jgi:large subunit ribosomal protein L10